MLPHVRSPKDCLNFFSGRRDSESSRQSEPSRAFASHLGKRENTERLRTRFTELAGEINTALPEDVVNRVIAALNGSRILAIDLVYKPTVDDERESPSHVLMDLLSDRGARLEYYHPYVAVIKPTRELSHWAGRNPSNGTGQP
jgi:UDP-N-acetyl-D-mannosaminuronate dehydrogenase